MLELRAKVEPAQAKAIAPLARGSLARALALAQGEEPPVRELIDALGRAPQTRFRRRAEYRAGIVRRTRSGGGKFRANRAVDRGNAMLQAARHGADGAGSGSCRGDGRTGRTQRLRRHLHGSRSRRWRPPRRLTRWRIRGSRPSNSGSARDKRCGVNSGRRDRSLRNQRQTSPRLSPSAFSRPATCTIISPADSS